MSSSPAFDALGFTFTITASDSRLASHLHGLFAALRTSAPAEHAYRVIAIQGGGPPTTALLLDGVRIGTAPDPEALIRDIVHDLNQRASESRLLTIHAAGAEHAGMALMLPGAMEAGKTTLVAGLVRAGFGYLSDETVGIDFETGMAHPYAKPLSLDPGSWPLFPELEPKTSFATSSYKRDQWQVAPDWIRAGAGVGPCPVGLLVFPSFETGANTRLEPLRRAAAVIELASCTFAFRDRGAAALDLIADVARGADCYRLTMGDLDRAVDLVTTLTRARPSRQRTA
jgi:hypothetical protein